jgi:CubicO group peptidase (beta-lactamase class C family)
MSRSRATLPNLWAVTTLLLLAAVPAIRGDEGADDAFAFPDTAVGRRAAAFLDMHNDLSVEVVRRFYEQACSAQIRERFTAEALTIQFAQIHEAVGDLEPHTILERGDHTLAVLVEFGSGGGWGRLDFAVEDVEPHRLTRFTIVPVEAPELAEIAYDDWTTLEDLLERAREDGTLPAIVAAVVQGDEIVDHAAVGVRALGADAVVTIDDRFHYGSVTKSMTATMLGRLVERGDLEWDTTLGEALPDVDMRDEYRAVTIEQLLRHRGGVPQHLHFNGEEMARLTSLPGSPTEQRAAFVAEVLLQEPLAEPGTAMHYSNAGYAVAAFVAERRTGRAWEDLIRVEVLEPLDMERSGFGWPATPQRPEQPRGHRGERPLELDEYDLGVFIAPAGNVHGSVDDLARYARAHLRGLAEGPGDTPAYLAPETIKRLHTPPADGAYAFGWIVEPAVNGETMHWHNGSAGTFYAFVAILPASDRAIVVITNAGGSRAESVTRKVVDAITRRVPAQP